MEQMPTVVNVPAPVVNVSVEPTPVTVQNNVEPAAVTVENTVNPEVKAPDVTVNVPERRKRKVRVQRNNDGVITGMEEQ
jgi:hypothetical protein